MGFLLCVNLLTSTCSAFLLSFKFLSAASMACAIWTAYLKVNSSLVRSCFWLSHYVICRWSGFLAPVWANHRITVSCKLRSSATYSAILSSAVQFLRWKLNHSATMTFFGWKCFIYSASNLAKVFSWGLTGDSRLQSRACIFPPTVPRNFLLSAISLALKIFPHAPASLK